MNGPRHYAEAERLLVAVTTIGAGSVAEPGMLAEAQVHATLALAAATALGSFRASDDGMPGADGDAWLIAASADEGYRETARRSQLAVAARKADAGVAGTINATASGGSIAAGVVRGHIRMGGISIDDTF